MNYIPSQSDAQRLYAEWIFALQAMQRAAEIEAAARHRYETATQGGWIRILEETPCAQS